MGHENIKNEPVIYAANHGSEMDGFMLLATLKENAILFVAPLQQFPFPLPCWIKRMEGVDVRRDPIDDALYPKGQNKQKAIRDAAHQLKKGQSLIMFPEGHIEYFHVLHYFHTGASRISTRAQIPIVPVAIIGGSDRFPGSKHVSKGTVIVKFGESIKPPVESSIKSHAQIRSYRDTLEEHLVDMLPSRYLPKYYHAKKPKSIGVFVDIDKTIYKGLSQVDFLFYLLSLHKMHRQDLLRAMYWLFLDKANLLEHTDMIKKEIKLVMKGWDIGEFDALIHRSFQERAIKKINYDFFSTFEDHIKAGHTVVFVSEVVHPMAREFKRYFNAKSTIDTHLEKCFVHNRCKYTGDVKCFCYKEKKAELVEEFAKHAHVDLKKSYGFSDSSKDIPFLKVVGNPAVINPDKKLKQYADEHRWPVLVGE